VTKRQITVATNETRNAFWVVAEMSNGVRLEGDRKHSV